MIVPISGGGFIGLRRRVTGIRQIVYEQEPKRRIVITILDAQISDNEICELIDHASSTSQVIQEVVRELKKLDVKIDFV